MGPKKKRKRYEDEAALFSDARPAGSSPSRSSPDSDEAYEAFRRHLEEHIQAETRAFHQLRAEAEAKLHRSPLVAHLISSEAPRPSVEKPKPRPPAAPEIKSAPRTASMPSEQLPRPKTERPWMTGLLCLSFALSGGLGLQFWQANKKEKTRELAQKSKSAAAPLSSTPVAAQRPAPRPRPAMNPLAATVSGLPQGLASPPPPPSPAPSAPAPSSNSPVTASSSSASAVAQAPAACAPEKSQGEGQRERGIIVGNGEVRRGPFLQYEILDALPTGSIIEGELTSDRQWLRMNGGRFMALSQLELLDPKAGENWFDRWVGAKIANVRKLPAMQAQVQQKLNLGEKIRIAPLNKQWAKLESGGFIYLPLVSETDPEPLRLPALMRVAAAQATIYAAPAADAAAVGVYFKNHKVQVLEAKDGWLKIGAEQFIKSQDLEQIAVTDQGVKRL